MTQLNRTGSIVSMVLLGALLSGNGWAADPPPASANTAVIPAQAQPPRNKPLDLRAPDITQLFTPEQLNKVLANTYVREEIEEVQVESAREHRPTDTPNVWPGIAAPFWAMLNPAQSWRIFAPLPPDQTRGMDIRANATDAYVLDPAGVPSPFAH